MGQLCVLVQVVPKERHRKRTEAMPTTNTTTWLLFQQKERVKQTQHQYQLDYH